CPTPGRRSHAASSARKDLAMVDQDASQAAVLAIVDDLRTAWNTLDAKAFAAVFAEDADFTNVFGISAKGRARIETTHAAIFNTVFKDSRWTETEPRVRFIRPDVANVDVRWQVIGSLDPEGRPWPHRRGLMNFIATRDSAGSWSIAVFHNMDLPSVDR